jgi:hypothetical protein
MSSWALTYSQGAQSQLIYVFGGGSNQHLYAKFWNWANPISLWADLGVPANTQSVSGLTTVTYSEAGQPRILVFGPANTGHLYVDTWNGTTWTWSYHGEPPGGLTWWGASAIAFYQAPAWRIYVFIGNGQGFHVNYWNGSQWNWADQGKPSGTDILSSNPSAVTYAIGKPSKQRIYVFGSSETGHLYMNYWNGSKWSWVDLGTPPGTKIAWFEGSISRAEPSAITYPQGLKQRVYVFVVGDDHHLYVKYFNGSKWAWAAQGAPSGTTLNHYARPAVITYTQAGQQRIYAFVGGVDGHLHVNYWNGSQWSWADLGSPTGTEVGGIDAITFLKSGTQHIYALAWCSDGRLHADHWDGSSWTWLDLGTPP